MNKKRFKIFGALIYTGFLFLLVTIFCISVLNNEDYSIKASSQRVENLYEIDVRGTIYDRNMIPFVNGRTNEKVVENVKYNEILRYDEKTLAKHLIGYVNKDYKAMSGLEKEYNPFLETDKIYAISKVYDVLNNEIKELGTRRVNKPDSESNLKLTLDYHIQKIVEDEMDKNVQRGSVVVMDANTFDVLAIASRPDYDAKNMHKYVENGTTELLDRSLSSYNAGSIFKIITTAALIEENNLTGNELFLCPGSKKLNSNVFNCHKRDGHIFLNLKDAFEQSCNCVYYDIGLKLGGEKILNMARKFKLGEKILDLSWEKSGNIPVSKNTNADTLNVSIGQGDVLITPLQACFVSCVIANGGIAKKVNVVNSVVDENGKVIYSFKNEKQEKIIEKSTAILIAEMMRGCVTNGTGKSADSKKVNISGKTGTAESGWMEDGKSMVHGWFTGFFPFENPKYAVSVLLENGRTSKNAAIVFKNIAEKIIELND